MNRACLTSILLALSVLAGCAPSKQEYAAIQETVRGSAKARKLAMSQCLKDWSSSSRRNASIILDVSEKDAPRLACARTIEAVRSGKLEYQDIVDIKRGNVTPKLVKMLQGR